MNENKYGGFRHYGRDGGVYNNYFDMIAANTRYEQMEKLIKAQNDSNINNKHNNNYNNNNYNNNNYNSNYNNNYIRSTNNFSALSNLNIIQFIIYLIFLVYPYVLSYFIIGYLFDESILLTILCMCIVWVTYLPILTRVSFKL